MVKDILQEDQVALADLAVVQEVWAVVLVDLAVVLAVLAVVLVVLAVVLVDPVAKIIKTVKVTAVGYHKEASAVVVQDRTAVAVAIMATAMTNRTRTALDQAAAVVKTMAAVINTKAIQTLSTLSKNGQYEGTLNNKRT